MTYRSSEQSRFTQAKDKEHFEKIRNTQDHIQKIKLELIKLIEGMNKNTSLFSRAAIFWNELVLWQKITAGAILTVPFFMIGIMANISALIMLSIVTVIVYTVSSIILDNHQNQNKDNTERLNKGILSLVDVLDKVISTLDVLIQELTIEIDAIQKENILLSSNIEQFCAEIDTLKLQISALKDTEKALRATQIELERTTNTLNGSLEEQSLLVDATKKELELAVQRYNENQIQLSEKIKKLSEIKVQMGKELEQAKSTSLVLRGTVESLSKIAMADKEQRAAFQLRLNDFLTNKEKSFAEIVAQACDAADQLSTVTKQVEQTNEGFRVLLERQGQMVARLEEIDLSQCEAAQESFNGGKPSSNGFYSVKKESPLDSVLIHGDSVALDIHG